MNTRLISSFFTRLFLCCLLLGLPGSMQALAQIVLKDEAIDIKQQTFYISQVQDEQSQKTAVAELATRTADRQVKVVATNLQAGPATAISRYLQHNLPAERSRWPVIMQIKDLKITETASADGRIEGQINVALDFGLDRTWGFEHLIAYPGRLRYVRSVDNAAAVERNLRSILKGGLEYLNQWIRDNAETSRKLATSVKISIGDYTERMEGDTIYYSPKRPLTWADFQSTLRPSGPYQAAVMPSIGYTQEAKVNNGTIEVKLLMKAYVPKSACWANATGRDDYALNHEQRHFDIVKIIAEQFKQKLQTAKLKPDTYEAFINMQYLDSFRDMDKMQKAYDGETAHGLNRGQQEQWNSRIDAALKSGGEIKQKG
jgi:hypothetical protein